MQENKTEYSAGAILDDVVPEDAMAFLEQISQAIDASLCVKSIEDTSEQKALNAELKQGSLDTASEQEDK